MAHLFVSPLTEYAFSREHGRTFSELIPDGQWTSVPAISVTSYVASLMSVNPSEPRFPQLCDLYFSAESVMLGTSFMRNISKVHYILHYQNESWLRTADTKNLQCEKLT